MCSSFSSYQLVFGQNTNISSTMTNPTSSAFKNNTTTKSFCIMLRHIKQPEHLVQKLSHLEKSEEPYSKN